MGGSQTNNKHKKPQIRFHQDGIETLESLKDDMNTSGESLDYKMKQINSLNLSHKQSNRNYQQESIQKNHINIQQQQIYQLDEIIENHSHYCSNLSRRGKSKLVISSHGSESSFLSKSNYSSEQMASKQSCTYIGNIYDKNLQFVSFS